MSRRFFQRYFEDFTEERVPDAQGKLRRSLIYRGFYFVPRLTGGRYALRAVALVLLYALGAAAFVYAASREAVCNKAWYVALSTGLSLIGLVMLALPLFSCAFGGKRQTVYQFRSGSRRCVRWSLIAAGMMALTALLAAFSCLSAGAGAYPAPLFLAGAALICAIGALENRVVYERAHNPAASA